MDAHALQLGELAVRATRHGVGPLSYAATRGTAFRRPVRGVVLDPLAPDDLVTRAHAVSLRLPDVAWYSHTSAAMLHGLPVPKALRSAPLHVTVPRGVRAPRMSGVIGHQRAWPLETHDARMLTSANGELLPIRLETPAVTLFSAAHQLNLADAVALGDAILFRFGEPVRTEWEALLQHTIRRAGGRAFRRTLPLVRSGVRSRAETHLRLMIAAAGLPEPTIAHPVEGEGWVQHPDLAWPRWKVLVEYEGDGHRTSSRQFTSDLRRFDRYADVGWHAIRASRLDVYRDPPEMLARVERRLRHAGWRPARGWALRRVAPFVA